MNNADAAHTSSPFKHRGFTLQGVPADPYARDLLDWMSTQGLNRLEIPVTSNPIHARVPNYPEMCVPEARKNTDRVRRLVEYGRSVGVRIVLVVRHSEAHSHWVKPHPDWRIQGTIPHPSGVDLACSTYCFRHPGVSDFYRALVRSLAADLGADEVQFWLRKPACGANAPAAQPAALTAPTTSR